MPTWDVYSAVPGEIARSQVWSAARCLTFDGEIHRVGAVVEVDRPCLAFGQCDGDTLLLIRARVETVTYDSARNRRPDVPVSEGEVTT
jgi:hypothetical protein